MRLVVIGVAVLLPSALFNVMLRPRLLAVQVQLLGVLYLDLIAVWQPVA